MTLNRTFALLGTAALTLASADAARAQAVPHFIAPQTYVSNAAADVRSLNNILGLSVAFGRCGGGFDAPVRMRVGAFVRALRAADFNHEGRTDLLLVTLTGAAVVPGGADGTFGAAAASPLPHTGPPAWHIRPVFAFVGGAAWNPGGAALVSPVTGLVLTVDTKTR